MDWPTQHPDIIDRSEISESLNDIPETQHQIIKPIGPQPVPINVGLCTNCDFLGRCVWQHNNKINCQHYQ